VESTYQLEELIDSLLEVTRLEAGKAELSLEKMSIPEIVNDVLERFEPQVLVFQRSTCPGFSNAFIRLTLH